MPAANLCRNSAGDKPPSEPATGRRARQHPDAVIGAAINWLAERGWQIGWRANDLVLLARPGSKLTTPSWRLDAVVEIAAQNGFPLQAVADDVVGRARLELELRAP